MTQCVAGTDQMTTDCVFCKIARGVAEATIVRDFIDGLAIVPLNPVTPGHVIVLPRTHVRDAIEYPWVTAKVMEMACSIAPYGSNIITSIGTVATQSVMHLHIHIVPRHEGDGLHLPWTGQRV